MHREPYRLRIDCHCGVVPNYLCALGVCDYLAETARCPSQLAKMPLEGSIITVVEGMFLEGAANHAMATGADPKLLATTAAWAIFGAARRWYQTSDGIPAEENGFQD